jgi:hypothetical protein
VCGTTKIVKLYLSMVLPAAIDGEVGGTRLSVRLRFKKAWFI